MVMGGGEGEGEGQSFTIAEKTKKCRRKLISHLELFQQFEFINFYIYITCRLQKPQEPL